MQGPASTTPAQNSGQPSCSKPSPRSPAWLRQSKPPHAVKPAAKTASPRTYIGQHRWKWPPFSTHSSPK
eukprot:3664673-Alexandrium_andersonii.AAC.1